VQVFASALRGPATEDTLNISLSFANGSIGTISYFANGPKSLPKEYIEVYRAGLTAVIRDFKELEVYGAGRSPRKRRLLSQDKGQARMLAQTVEAMKKGGPSPIPFEDIYSTTLATFKALESLRTGVSVRIAGG
jgi:predicted dehydrogenase